MPTHPPRRTSVGLAVCAATVVATGCASPSSISLTGGSGGGGVGGQTTATAGDQSTGVGALTSGTTSATGVGVSGASGSNSASAGSGSGIESIAIVSGNGELVLAGWPGTDPLLVRVTKNGAPVANETVTWTTAGPLNTTSNQTTSTTDANGLTSMTIVGEQFNVTTSWVDGTVTAALPNGASAPFTVVIAYPGPPVGQGAVSPLAQIMTPTSVDLGHHKAGTTLTGGIQAIIAAQIGPDVGKGIPNVGARLANPNDWTQPATGVACASGTPLTDATGKVSCDVVFGATPGTTSFSLVLGGYNLHTMFVEIDP